MALPTLTDDEIKMLVTILDSALTDLSVEIADTDSREYREQLKENRIKLQGIFSKLKASIGE